MDFVIDFVTNCSSGIEQYPVQPTMTILTINYSKWPLFVILIIQFIFNSSLKPVTDIPKASTSHLTLTNYQQPTVPTSTKQNYFFHRLPPTFSISSSPNVNSFTKTAYPSSSSSHSTPIPLQSHPAPPTDSPNLSFIHYAFAADHRKTHISRSLPPKTQARLHRCRPGQPQQH